MPLPASGGVCPTLGRARCGGRLWNRSGHSGGGVGLCYSDLLGPADLFPTMRAEALTLQHGGASTMETVRDVDVGLALHEGPLHHQERPQVDVLLPDSHGLHNGQERWTFEEQFHSLTTTELCECLRG